MSGSSKAPSALGAPPEDLSKFPVFQLNGGLAVHRNHHRGRGPWWFASDGRGRFDLVQRPGHGTCYLAQSAVGSLLEAFRGLRVVSEDAVSERHELHAVLDRDLRLANCCVKRAARFGVNAEIHSTTDYSQTHAWAAAFHRAGLDGIRYHLRSDPSLKLIGYALFDQAGEGRAGRWPAGSSAPVSEETLREAESYGFEVLPAPISFR